MSDMEYNKGRLIPTGVSVKDMSEEEQDNLYDDDGIAVVNGLVYKVEWEARKEDLYELARANINDDGSIDFETYHYNGGGHWTEVVESALKHGD